MSDSRGLIEPLTARELEILNYLVEGLSNREIAQTVHLAYRTVKWYNSQIYEKLGVSNRQEAVAQAKALQLVNTPSGDVTHNLPTAMTAFVGRAQEMTDILDLLSTRRLITILAPGGMGKTRLSIAVAHRARHQFKDGVYFVSLAPIDDTTHLVSTISTALELRLSADIEPKQYLLDFLAEQQLLLVLDNFEHVLDGASLVSDMLRHAPGITLLVTSRERLGLSGEQIYTIGGMVFPDFETPADALEYDAVKLFMQGAQLVRSDFELHQDQLPYLARICRLTEGMPLAIVLASAWVDVLSLQEIAAEIQQSIDFLAVEMRDLPRRQWSIRAVYEPTWNRLSTDEQAVFMRLTVFRGGCTREAAAMVAGATLRHLQTFVSKALLTRTAAGRYEIHELLRHYAEEQLLKSGHLDETQHAHAQYFADFLHQRDESLKGHEQLETLSEIEADFENIRNMWLRAIETEDHALFYQSAETICWYCYFGLHLTEGEQLFTDACTSLEHRLDNNHANHIWSHLQLRCFWIRMSRYGIPKPYDVMMQQVEQWREVAQDAGNETDVALSYCFLGAIAISAEHDDALTLLKESLTQFQELSNTFYCAWVLHFHYMYWENKEVATSLVYQHQVLAIGQQLGGRYALGQSLFCVSLSELELGNLEASEKYARDMLMLTTEKSRYSWVSPLLADVIFLKGDFEGAQTESVNALNAYVSTRQDRIKEFSLLKLGMVACVYGDFSQAMEYYQQALTTNSTPRHLYYFNWLLALAKCGLGDYTIAIPAISYALTTSIQIGAIGRITWCLPAIVMIEIHRGNVKHAVQFLSLAFNHPRSATGWLENWRLMGEIKDQLRQELGNDLYAQIWEDSKNLDMTQVVSDWLVDIGGDSRA